MFFTNKELSLAYGVKYSKKGHDNIADAFVKSVEVSHAADAATAEDDDFKIQVRKMLREIRRKRREEAKWEVSLDGEILPALNEGSLKKSISCVFQSQYEYSLCAERAIENKLLFKERQALINVLLSSHKKRIKRILLMYYGEDLTLVQIGKRFKCSKSTVKRRLDDALSQLSAIVKREGLTYKNYTRIESKFVELKNVRPKKEKRQPEPVKYYRYDNLTPLPKAA